MNVKIRQKKRVVTSPLCQISISSVVHEHQSHLKTLHNSSRFKFKSGNQFATVHNIPLIHRAMSLHPECRACNPCLHIEGPEKERKEKAAVKGHIQTGKDRKKDTETWLLSAVADCVGGRRAFDNKKVT